MTDLQLVKAKALGKVIVEPAKGGAMRISQGSRRILVPEAEVSEFAASVAGMAIALALVKR